MTRLPFPFSPPPGRANLGNLSSQLPPCPAPPSRPRPTRKREAGEREGDGTEYLNSHDSFFSLLLSIFPPRRFRHTVPPRTAPTTLQSWRMCFSRSFHTPPSHARLFSPVSLRLHPFGLLPKRQPPLSAGEKEGSAAVEFEGEIGGRAERDIEAQRGGSGGGRREGEPKLNPRRP